MFKTYETTELKDRKEYLTVSTNDEHSLIVTEYVRKPSLQDFARTDDED